MSHEFEAMIAAAMLIALHGGGGAVVASLASGTRSRPALDTLIYLGVAVNWVFAVKAGFRFVALAESIMEAAL